MKIYPLLLKKERKRLFSKLDEEKKSNRDSSSTFKEIKKLKIVVKSLDILYNKENSEDNKGKEKNDIPGEIKTEKKINVATPNLVENNDIKIERVNKSKINTSEDKNPAQKEEKKKERTF
jgi:hypothetical protein